ncbi:gag-protease polyprotein [Trifolium medium]|uniref:Gag-protease polyprotein n=1 Tax=Trifolium medium TaxID=97028 RepID=A0A392MSQ9_9FABA|nr:gag-protease polyprotein [Trifolium medium]
MKRIIKEFIQDKEELISTVAHLEEEVTLLNSNLTNMTKSVRMLNKGSEVLDEVLEIGKRYPQHRGYKNLRCHHCGRYGHIRPQCFKLYGYQNWNPPKHNKKKSHTKKVVKSKATYKDTQIKKEWKPKATMSCMIAHATLRGSKEDWYLDDGYP